MSYNFSTSPQRYHQTTSAIELSAGRFGIRAGDVNSSGAIYAEDYAALTGHLGRIGYVPHDLDLNGFVNLTDLELYFLNQGTKSD